MRRPGFFLNFTAILSLLGSLALADGVCPTPIEAVRKAIAKKVQEKKALVQDSEPQPDRVKGPQHVLKDVHAFYAKIKKRRESSWFSGQNFDMTSEFSRQLDRLIRDLEKGLVGLESAKTVREHSDAGVFYREVLDEAKAMKASGKIGHLDFNLLAAKYAMSMTIRNSENIQFRSNVKEFVQPEYHRDFVHKDLEMLRQLIEENPERVFIPTDEELDFGSFGRSRQAPVSFFGLSSQDVPEVDGFPENPYGFFVHDWVHENQMIESDRAFEKGKMLPNNAREVQFAQQPSVQERKDWVQYSLAMRESWGRAYDDFVNSQSESMKLALDLVAGQIGHERDQSFDPIRNLKILLNGMNVRGLGNQPTFVEHARKLQALLEREGGSVGVGEALDKAAQIYTDFWKDQVPPELLRRFFPAQVEVVPDGLGVSDSLGKVSELRLDVQSPALKELRQALKNENGARVASLTKAVRTSDGSNTLFRYKVSKKWNEVKSWARPERQLEVREAASKLYKEVTGNDLSTDPMIRKLSQTANRTFFGDAEAESQANLTSAMVQRALGELAVRELERNQSGVTSEEQRQATAAIRESLDLGDTEPAFAELKKKREKTTFLKTMAEKYKNGISHDQIKKHYTSAARSGLSMVEFERILDEVFRKGCAAF